MNRLSALAGTLALLSSPSTFGQEPMQYGVKQLKILAEDEAAA
jgi:hypothetical protein